MQNTLINTAVQVNNACAAGLSAWTMIENFAGTVTLIVCNTNKYLNYCNFAERQRYSFLTA